MEVSGRRWRPGAHGVQTRSLASIKNFDWIMLPVKASPALLLPSLSPPRPRPNCSCHRNSGGIFFGKKKQKPRGGPPPGPPQKLLLKAPRRSAAAAGDPGAGRKGERCRLRSHHRPGFLPVTVVRSTFKVLKTPACSGDRQRAAGSLLPAQP